MSLNAFLDFGSKVERKAKITFSIFVSATLKDIGDLI